jgi:hypothetical protein
MPLRHKQEKTNGKNIQKAHGWELKREIDLR